MKAIVIVIDTNTEELVPFERLKNGELRIPFFYDPFSCIVTLATKEQFPDLPANYYYIIDVKDIYG